MNKKITREERQEIYKEGLKECVCDNPGQCQIFMLAMSKNLHDHCKNSQSYRDWFLESAKRRDTDKHNEDYQEKLTRYAAKAKVDNAILALQHKGVSLKDEKSAGLGDTVAKVLGSFGITKKIVSKALGSGCKCEQRRKWLNTIFPYGIKDD